MKYHVYLGSEWTATYDSALPNAESLAKQAAQLIGGTIKIEFDNSDKDDTLIP